MAYAMSKLNQSEEWFWKCTPRKLIALIDSKTEIDKEEMKTQGAYIACCVWGGNPNEIDNKPEVLGVDKPVDPTLLKGWL